MHAIEFRRRPGRILSAGFLTETHTSAIFVDAADMSITPIPKSWSAPSSSMKTASCCVAARSNHERACGHCRLDFSKSTKPRGWARREAREEACAEIVINALLAVYTVPHISQVQLMYRARLDRPVFAAGPESLEVGLFGWNEIPWAELAFPSVKWALEHFRASKDLATFAPFSNPVSPAGSIAGQILAAPPCTGSGVGQNLMLHDQGHLREREQHRSAR